jgi:hypothetical protein
LLSALAAKRKQTPRGLAKQVDAARFALETYPEMVSDWGVRGGHSQIEFLEKIHKMDPAEAHLLAPKVLGGQMTMRQIREAYALCLEKTESAGPASAVAARRRAIEFDKTCITLMYRHAELFGASFPDDIRVGYRIGRIGLDAAVVKGGVVIAGMESRVGGVSTASRDAMPLLSRFALLRYRVETMWLLVPKWAQHFAEAVRDEAEEWKVPGVRIALVDESSSEPRLEVIS